MPRAYATRMTITEQLQFSVLTAPVASLDRRALSQAWYSALYGNGCAASTKKPAQRAPQAGEQVRTPRGTPASTPAADVTRAPARSGPAKSPAQAEASPVDRRAPRSALARKIERAFLRPRSATHKTSFTVEGDQGRVHVLLQTRGSQLKLVAICPPRARAGVAAALAQARYALALRGIDVDAETRGASPC
jgi:hypothetical protein